MTDLQKEETEKLKHSKCKAGLFHMVVIPVLNSTFRRALLHRWHPESLEEGKGVVHEDMQESHIPGSHKEGPAAQEWASGGYRIPLGCLSQCGPFLPPSKGQEGS